MITDGALAYLVIFLGGVAGSLHCVGMCGGFPLALAGARRRRPVVRQLLYNAGRLQALVFIGAMSGMAGGALVAVAPVAAVERGLAIDGAEYHIYEAHPAPWWIAAIWVAFFVFAVTYLITNLID